MTQTSFEIKRVNDVEAIKRLVRIIPSRSELMLHQIIADYGMVIDGHISYEDLFSKKESPTVHSRYFLRFRNIGNNQYACMELAKELLNRSGMKLGGHKILTPETSGGFSLGHSVSQLVKPNNREGHVVVRMDDLDRKLVQNSNQLFRCEKIAPDEEVVIVNDVDRTGSSLDRIIKIVRQCQGQVKKVLVFATWDHESFQKRMSVLGVEGFALIEFKAESWIKANCEVCRKYRHGLHDEHDDLKTAFEMS